MIQPLRGEGPGVGFDELVAPHQSSLLAHCYRMTGSLHDAEDALQETLLRAWRGLDGFEGRSSVRTWLFTIATNACYRLVEQRARRLLPVDLGPASDPNGALRAGVEDGRWLTPFGATMIDTSPAGRYEAKESVELAFVAALQHLPARQRAVLLLRDVLAFSAAETATALDSSVASVNSALQRARATLASRVPSRSQQNTLSSLDDGHLKALVDQFVTAWEQRDVDALVSLMTADVEFTMPPESAWFRGSEDVGVFLRDHPLSAGRRWAGTGVETNGQLACALWLDTGSGFRPESVTVLTVDPARSPLLGAVTAFRMPELFERLGLPATPSASRTR